MRLLLDTRDPSRPGGPNEDLTDEALTALYAFPDGRGLRANFVSTLDGSAVGADGLSGSINTPPDNRIFALQRRLADAVLIGAGTARAEGYRLPTPSADRPTPPPLVVVSGAAAPPPALLGTRAAGARGILVTSRAAGEPAIAHAREAVGARDVWVLGDDAVDLASLLARLAAEGMPHVLAEGGPTLFASLLAEGLVDELALTLAPTIVGGLGLRVTQGPPVDIAMAPRVLLEEDGTLLGLWHVSPHGPAPRAT